MKSTEFLLTGSGFLALTAVCYYLIKKAIDSAVIKVSWPESEKNRFINRARMITGGWILLASLTSLTGFYTDFTSLPPRLALLIIPPLIFIIYLTFFSAKIKDLLKVIPPHWLIYIQAFRIPVELLLWFAFIKGITPVQMTLEGRNWDILSGILAIPAGYLAFRNGSVNKTVIVIYNLVGLALVINIVTIALLSAPTPFRIFMNEPSNYAVAHFPMILLPAFLVPVAYGMHFLSLRQLLVQK
jgi:hypothetical protein